MNKDFHPGSLWRRWDLHIHTPGTALADNFKGWPTFLDGLEQPPSAVAVIGITDYLSIRGYERVLGFKNEGRLSNISLIVPNIEFRISPETRNAKGINLHLLISPHPQDHCERINEALSCLTIKVQRETIPCNRNGFIRLGRSFDKANLDEEAPDGYAQLG
jgi:hypothetical protein